MRADVIYQRLSDPSEYVRAYNALMETPSNRLRIAAVVESLAGITGPVRRVLDVASGGGAYVTPARQANGNLAAARFFALDREAACVGAYCLNHPEAAGALGDVSSLPFESGSFDLALCLDIVEHLNDDSGFLKEVRRVLRPGGHVVLCTHNAWSLEHLIGLTTSAVRGRRWSGWDPTHVRFYHARSLKTLLEQVGFEIVGFNGTYYLPFHLPALLLSWPLERAGTPGLAARVHRIVQAPGYWLNLAFEQLSSTAPLRYLGWGIIVVARRA